LEIPEILRGKSDAKEIPNKTFRESSSPFLEIMEEVAFITGIFWKFKLE